MNDDGNESWNNAIKEEECSLVYFVVYDNSWDEEFKVDLFHHNYSSTCGCEQFQENGYHCVHTLFVIRPSSKKTCLMMVWNLPLMRDIYSRMSQRPVYLCLLNEWMDGWIAKVEWNEERWIDWRE